MLRALIAGSDADEITDLARRATTLFGTSCHYYALELDTSSTGPALALGTSQPVVRRLVTTDDPAAAEAEEPVMETASGTERPLGEDGDTAPTILDTAHDFGADVIITAVRHKAGSPSCSQAQRHKTSSRCPTFRF